jgi:alkylation response protein AidB-like acyl-CoA dehydrogenase
MVDGATQEVLDPKERAAWAASWKMEVANIRSDLGYQSSAEQLRALEKTKLLTLTDLRDDPEKFFLAHRLMAERAPELGPGFWIRFTVHYNLFAGTVVALGRPDQVAALRDIQEKGQLGCFGLTEKLAGVNSGLVALTTATYDEKEKVFVLQSATDGARKNWISQGLVADKAVVVADLFVAGKRHGPHAFLIDFRRDGKVVEGIELGDMGRKTVGNDLDNAWISFNRVKVPAEAMLSKYAAVEDGVYVQKVKGVNTMSMIGQRLFTGRVAVAQAALTFARVLYNMTRNYSDNKACWAPGGKEQSLSVVPQLRGLYREAAATLDRADRYVQSCETDLCACLRRDAVPPLALQADIAVAKILGAETAISLCFRLKQEVGSHALMGGTGFEQMDFLQACKFAEGDTRILMQKIARDRVKAKQPFGNAEEERLVAKLRQARSQDEWDDAYVDVYGLAQQVIDRTVAARLESAKL